MKILILFLVVFTAATFAQASSLLQLHGDGRVVTIYSENEIPDFLRSDSCENYAYEQRFDGPVYIRGAQVAYPAAAGSTQSDLRILQRNDVCMLRLKVESMLQDQPLPVTIYEIDTLGKGVNETRAGANHRAMDDGDYVLKNGTKFKVTNNVVTWN